LNSEYRDTVQEFSGINNSSIIPLDNSTELFTNDSEGQFVIDIVFSKDFDSQVKNKFLDNVKSNNFFSDMIYLEKEQNFTEVDTKYVLNKTTDEYMINNNLKEYKIIVSPNEIELQDNYKFSKSNVGYIQRSNYYGIVFKSLTKYNIFFPYRNDKELIEILKISDNDFENFDYSWQDRLLVIQNIIDNSLIKIITNVQNYTVSTKNMDKEVIEKESRIKESLVIIGLKKSSFWISWAITYGLIIAFSSTLVTIAMYYFKFFTSIHWSVKLPILLV
ncbi:hypothetical protein PIROE2DRAFT_2620, partial [Piromyces sp. E2]